MIQALLFLLGVRESRACKEFREIRECREIREFSEIREFRDRCELLTYHLLMRYTLSLYRRFCLYIGLRCRSYPDREAIEPYGALPG